MPINRRRQRDVINALCAALLLHALIPVGYMPSAVSGGLPFVLCPDNLPVSVAAILEGDGHHHNHGKQESATIDQCDFGEQLSHAAAPTEFSALAINARAPVFGIPVIDRFVERHLFGHYARGPPRP